MTVSGAHYPSWATTTVTGGLLRSDGTGVFPIEVIMAIKLMSPAAYHVDYEHHGQGEDVGWSLACRPNRLKLGVDARTAYKHAMSPAMLDRADPRCAF